MVETTYWIRLESRGLAGNGTLTIARHPETPAMTERELIAKLEAAGFCCEIVARDRNQQQVAP